MYRLTRLQGYEFTLHVSAVAFSLPRCTSYMKHLWRDDFSYCLPSLVTSWASCSNVYYVVFSSQEFYVHFTNHSLCNIVSPLTSTASFSLFPPYTPYSYEHRKMYHATFPTDSQYPIPPRRLPTTFTKLAPRALAMTISTCAVK